MLDIRTILALTVVYSLVIGVSIIVFAPRRKYTQGILLMGSGILTYGLGFLLIAFREYIGTFLTVIVANTLIILGLMVILMGLTQFRYLKIPWIYQNIPLISIQFLSFLYFTYRVPSVNSRIIIISVITSILFSEIAYIFLNYPDPAIRKQILIISGFFIFAIVVNLIRIIFTLNEAPMGSFMTAGFIHSLSVIIFQVMPYTLSMGTFWITNAWIEEELTTQTMTDSLTGLLNRMAIMDIAQREFSRGRRYDTPIGVAMCDLDRFKKVNDAYGHQVGDQVLTTVAKTLESSIRKEDYVGRYGGEEFLFIFPGIEEDQLLELLEKLRCTIEKLQILAGEEVIHSTLSFGGFVEKGPYSLNKAISAADQALYKAKENGRNQVQLKT